MRFGLAMVFCLAGLVLAAPAWGAPSPGLVAAYRRSAIVRLGGFGEGFNGEDADASMRIGRLG